MSNRKISPTLSTCPHTKLVRRTILTPSEYEEIFVVTNTTKFFLQQLFSTSCVPRHIQIIIYRDAISNILPPLLILFARCYFCIIIFKVLTRLTFFFSACEPFPTFSPLFPLSLYYRRNLGREIPQP